MKLEELEFGMNNPINNVNAQIDRLKKIENEIERKINELSNMIDNSITFNFIELVNILSKYYEKLYGEKCFLKTEEKEKYSFYYQNHYLIPNYYRNSKELFSSDSIGSLFSSNKIIMIVSSSILQSEFNYQELHKKNVYFPFLNQYKERLHCDIYHAYVKEEYQDFIKYLSIIQYMNNGKIDKNKVDYIIDNYINQSRNKPKTKELNKNN